MIRSLNGQIPRIAESAFISEAAYIVGNIEIGENSSVWPGTVIRGDLGSIRICSGADRETATWRDLPLSPVVTNYQRFAEAVRTGRPMKPDFATATRLQAVIDAAFEAHRAIPRTEIAS